MALNGQAKKNYNLITQTLINARDQNKCSCGAPPYYEKDAKKKAAKSKGKYEFFQCSNETFHVRKTNVT